MSRISFYLGTFEREGQMQKYYIFLNLEPAAGPAQAYTIVLQLPIIETRAEVLLGLARADGSEVRQEPLAGLQSTGTNLLTGRGQT